MALRQKIRKLDFQSLEIFYNLYVHKSVTRVSELLSLSQSTVSYSLNRLRTAFDDPLFVNSRAGMQPTQKAATLIESISEILDKISHPDTGSNIFSPKEVETVFKIFAPEYFEILVVPSLLKKILEDELKISIELIRPEEKIPYDDISEKKIDLAIVVRQKHYPYNLCHRSILQDKLVAVFDGDQTGIEPLTIEEFSLRKQIFPSPWLTSNCMVDSWLNSQGVNRTIAVKANGYYSGLKMLTGSEMMMMLPEKVFNKIALQHIGLHSRQAPLGLPGFELDMIWSHSCSESPANMWLREQIMMACEGINQA